MLSFARVRAIAIIAVLFVAALVVVTIAMTNDDSTAVANQGECEAGSVDANLELPDASAIKINVYNATEQVGLASQVGENFANRDFDVIEQDDDPLDSQVDDVAELRYGPEAVGAAHVLRAYFLDTATTKFDIEREGDEVDVVIGRKFQQLATETEVRQSIAALGSPEAPAGTCGRIEQ